MKKNKSPIKYYDEHFYFEGKRYGVKGKTPEEALAKRYAKEAELKSGKIGISTVMTVENWARTWLKTYIKPKVRPPGSPKQRGTMTLKSCEMYEQKIDGYIIPAIGHKRMKDIRDVDLQAILNSSADMSFSHVAKLRMIICAMFEQAVISRIIDYNPSQRLTLPAVQKGKRRSLTDYERSILMQVAEKHHAGAWIKFMLYTGARPGEIPALRVSDLDFEDGLIHISRAIESGSNLEGAPKTEAGVRYVPIVAEIREELKALTVGKAPDDYVFTQTDGKSRLTQTSMTNGWRSFARQMDLLMGAEHTAHGHIYDPADILPDGAPIYPDPADKTKPRNGHRIAPDLVPYCLRHTYCTDTLRSGVSLEVVKYLMGHSDITTTSNTYSHPGRKEALAAAEILNGKR